MEGRLRRDADAAFAVGLVDQIIDRVDEGIIAADLDGTIVGWNLGAQRLYGYCANEIVGRHVSILPPPDRAHEPMEAILHVGQGQRLVVRETVRQHQDGRRIECTVSVAPVRDARGQVIGVCAIVRDLTEANRLTRRLSEREHQINGLLEQAVSGVFIVVRDGTIQHINSGFSKLFGYVPEEVVGRHVVEYIVEADQPRVTESMARSFLGHATTVEFRLVARGGSTRTVIGQSTVVPYDGQPALLGVVIDVTEHRDTAVALHRANRLLRTIGEANEELVRATTERDLMDRMCALLVSTGQMHSATIALLSDGGRLEIAASNGELAECGENVLMAEVLVRDGIGQFDPERGCVRLPLAQQGHILGCLCLATPTADPLEDDERTLLIELADDLAYGIIALRHRADREASAVRLRRSMEETIAALAATLEMRDPYTAGHQRHVAELAAAIGAELGMNSSAIAALRLAAVVHDIGKIKIPAEILTRPGGLTDVEELLLQTHATAGYEILKGIDFPWAIADIVWQHHERLDGSGYPRGLRGDAILPEARVLAVADVVEAMSADRPYRFGKGTAAALEALEDGRGIQYDAAAVDACLRLFDESRFSFSASPAPPHPDRPESRVRWQRHERANCE